MGKQRNRAQKGDHIFSWAQHFNFMTKKKDKTKKIGVETGTRRCINKNHFGVVILAVLAGSVVVGGGDGGL